LASTTWYLKRINIFAELEDSVLAELGHKTRMVQFNKGEYLYMPGDPSNAVFFLKEGRVKIIHLLEDGKEFTLAILEPGEVFGELALAGEYTRESAALAMGEVLVCTVDGAFFERFLNKRPDLSYKLTKIIGFRRREIEIRLADLAFKGVPSRIARLLLRLAEQYGTADNNGLKLKIRLGHQDIANLIGASRETVTLTLNRLRKEGILDFTRRSFIILKPEKLKDSI
jgi:CRP-like cAMP-binding protein